MMLSLIGFIQGSELQADTTYTDYRLEENIHDNQTNPLATGKSNSKKVHKSCIEYLISIHRKRIETLFSQLCDQLIIRRNTPSVLMVLEKEYYLK